MARARTAMLPAAVLLLSVVVGNSASAVGASRDVLQSSPAESPDFDLPTAEPPGFAEDAFTTYQYVAPALAVPNSYFAVDTELLGPAADIAGIKAELTSAPPPDGDGNPADDLISAGIVAAAAALLELTQTQTDLGNFQIDLDVNGVETLMTSPSLISQLSALGKLIRLIVPLATYGPVDLNVRFPNFGLLVEQWQAFLNSFVEFPEAAIDDLDADSIAQIYIENPRDLSEVQLYIYYFYHFTNPAVEDLSAYLKDPTNVTLQTAFLDTSVLLTTSTGTTYTPVSLFLDFAAVATNPSGNCPDYPQNTVYALILGIVGATPTAYCNLFNSYNGLGKQIGFDRSLYQPYAAALASYALLTAVMADATNAIVNVVYDGGSDQGWSQQYTDNQGWYITWIENVVAYYSNMAILFWNAQLSLDLNGPTSAYNQTLIANGNNDVSTQQIANGYQTYFDQKYPFLDWGFVFFTPSATSDTSLDGGQGAWGIAGGCNAASGPQPNDGNNRIYLVPPTTATAEACTANGGSIFIPYLLLENDPTGPPPLGVMIFFRNVEDNTRVPDSDSLNAIFTACQTANSGSSENTATCVANDYDSRGTLVVDSTLGLASALSAAAGFSTQSGSYFAVLPNAVGSGPATSPGADQELASPLTNAPAESAESPLTPASNAPSPVSDSLSPKSASGAPPAASPAGNDLTPAPIDGPSPSAR